MNVGNINSFQESVKAEGSDTAQALSAVALTRQVEYLQQQMVGLNLDQQLGAIDVNLSDPQGALQKYAPGNFSFFFRTSLEFTCID